MNRFPQFVSHLAALAFCHLALEAELEAESRIWTDHQGRTLEAEFVGLEGDTVLFKSSTGATVRVELAKLSAEDQKIAASSTPAPQHITIDGEVAAAAARLDGLIQQQLQKEGLKPNPLTTDEQFLRRVYLDIAGRIPNLQEANAFLENSAPDKRAQLIDTLLDSPGYVSHLYNYMADMFRVRDPDNSRLMKADPWVEWIKQSLRDDKPYDVFAREMLTADGKLWANGATGYLLRDSGMTLDNLANTFSIFLATDVACAQCHDHPFADWTQMQFFEMAAFFGATVTQVNDSQFKNGDPMERIVGGLMELAESSGADPEQVEKARDLLGDVIAANRFEVRDIGQNYVRLPGDYKYKDGKPGEEVKPKFIRWDGEDRYNEAYRQNRNTEEKLRESFAAWMTHPTNPRFAMSIANRMWKRAFGMGVGEPIRNIDDPNATSNPALIKQLAREMLRLKFSLKNFMRVVYNTRAYQGQAIQEAIPMGAPCYFQGPLVRRMTAEQTWDSFMTLVLGNPDAYRGDDGGLLGRSIDLDLDNVTPQIVASKLDGFKRAEEMAAARRGGGLDMASSGASAAPSPAQGKVLEYGGYKLLRAAELEQPAPEGHFLREFGQGDRNLIDGNHTEGSQPQV
ncbi:MAG: DUF1549 domain-containing protein, partial [Verrucomicrobiales bacterium]|nr:DUF1549 domain-containing protein [Verrucomicrobiales bacterium]